MIFLKILGRFIKVLRSNASPNQIAWGFALGTFLGFTPFLSLHNLIVVLLIFVLNVNVSAALFAFVLCSFLAFFLDPLFHTIGFGMLVQAEFLKSFWTALYNAPAAPFTRFNNTVVIGSFVFALVLCLPSYFLFKGFVQRYRTSWNDKIQKWKIVKVLKGSKVIKLYFKVRNMGN